MAEARPPANDEQVDAINHERPVDRRALSPKATVDWARGDEDAGTSIDAPAAAGDMPAGAETSGTSPEIPEKIGRYGIEKVLGKGGFGLVYLGHDDKLNRRVADFRNPPDIRRAIPGLQDLYDGAVSGIDDTEPSRNIRSGLRKDTVGSAEQQRDHHQSAHS